MERYVLVGAGVEAVVICNMLLSKDTQRYRRVEPDCWTQLKQIYVMDPFGKGHKHIGFLPLSTEPLLKYVKHIPGPGDLVDILAEDGCEIGDCSVVRAILDLVPWEEFEEWITDQQLMPQFKNVVGEGSLILGDVEGSVLHHGVHVGTGAKVSRGCILNTNAIIEHDVHIGNNCFVGPGAVLCGGVVLDHGVFVGTGAVVRPGVRVASRAFIEMGAVVVKDVPIGARVCHARSEVKAASSDSC